MITAARRAVAGAALVAASAATAVLAAPAADAYEVAIDTRGVITIWVDQFAYMNLTEHSGSFAWGICEKAIPSPEGTTPRQLLCANAVWACVDATHVYNYTNDVQKLPVIRIWPDNTYSCYSR